MKKKAAVASPEPATWLETAKSYGKLAADKADGFVKSIYSAVAARWESLKSPVSSHGDELPTKGKGRKNKPKGARRESKSKGAPATSSPSPTFSEIFFTFSERGWTRAAELRASAIESSKRSISGVKAALGRDVGEHTAAGLTIALLFSIILVAGSIFKRRVPTVRARAHAVSRSATDNAVDGGCSADPLSTVAASPAEPGIETETDKIEVSGTRDANADPDARDVAPEPSKSVSPSEPLAPSRESATFEPAQGPTSVSAAEAEARQPVTPEVPRCTRTAPHKAAPATLVTEVAGDVVAAAVAAVRGDIGLKATELASPAPANPAVEEEKRYASVEPRGKAANVGDAIVDADGHASNVVKDGAAGYTEDVAAAALVKEEMQSAPPAVDVATVTEETSSKRTPEAGNVTVQEILGETVVSFSFLLHYIIYCSIL